MTRILTTAETYCVQTLTSLDLLWIKGVLWIYTLQKSRERLQKLKYLPERRGESNPRQPGPFVMGFSTSAQWSLMRK